MTKLVRGAASTASVQGFAAALAFLLTLVVGRLLGPEGTGHFFIVLSIGTISVVVALLGTDTASLRLAAKHAAAGDEENLASAYGTSSTLVGLTSIAVAVLLWLAAPPLQAHFFEYEGLVGSLRIVAVGVPFLSQGFLHAELLRAREKVGTWALLRNAGYRLIGIPFIVVGALWFGRSGAVIGLTVGFVGVGLLGIILYRRGGVHGFRFDPRRVRSILSISLPLFLVASMNLIMNWTDTLMLGAFTDQDSVGIYEVAFQIALGVGLARTAVNSIAAPNYAALHESGTTQDLQKFVNKTSLLMVGATIPLFGAIALYPTWFLSLFGEGFISAKTPLLILIGAQLVNSFTGSNGYLLSMSEHENTLRNLTVLSSGTNILLNFTLIPMFGTVGAAWATGGSLVLQNVLGAALVWKKLGVSVIPTGFNFMEQSNYG